MTLRSFFGLLTIGLLLLLLPMTASAQTAAVPKVPRDTKFEASWTLPNQTGNPFDPRDNDVVVTFAGPKKLIIIQPAFWDGDRWRVRYAPTRPGGYTLAITRNGAAVTPSDLTPKRFRCVASDSPGFVRRDPKTTQHFVFDNGQTYYPVGMNVAWTGNTPSDYDSYFAQMQTAGMNWARVWMNNWDGKNLEWAATDTQNPKPGTYLMDAARRWDTIIDAAEAHGIYVQMTLQHHGQYTAHTDPNWASNPFNAANGGFLQNPDDFFTDAEARRLTRMKYRYITARWGYSTHLLSYELFNEVQNITETRSHPEDVVNWHKEMAAAIRAEDVNHHLITTSNSDPGTPLAQIGLDYDQWHSYVSDVVSFFAAVKGTDAPVFIGEWGPANFRTELTETFLHDGLWSSLMAPTAGAGQFWGWDDVQKNNWWPQFASTTGFLKAFNIGAQSDLTPMSPHVSSSGAYGDLSFTPTGGWTPFTRDTVTLASTGETPDLSGLSSFIQGTGHREMMPHPITFTLNCPVACQFRMTIATASHSGAHAVVMRDGQTVAEADFPVTPTNHDVNLPLTAELTAGPHTISVSNTGVDWFTVKSFTVTHYAPPIAALARGSTRTAVFWAYNRTRTGASPATGTVILSGLDPGTYTVRLWDTWAARELPSTSATAQGGTLNIPLPSVSKDIAGSVTRKP